MSTGARVVYLSHGGGPLPLLGDAGHRDMLATLRAIAGSLARPTAIVVVSAHWEEPVATVTASPQPELLYDYYGFPAAAYRIAYPCPGDAALAGRIRAALEDAHLAVALDAGRGLDHGVFVPLKIMYPEADIPVVQLSLLAGLDPAAHLALGRALRALPGAGLLVVGSGFSFHNMQAFFAAPSAQTDERNRAFETWLVETCTSSALGEAEREQRLLGWAGAPGARFCHPREEHLLPLHVCYGLAGGPCSAHYALRILGREASMYLW